VAAKAQLEAQDPSSETAVTALSVQSIYYLGFGVSSIDILQ
jgi:hypothetical protein